MAAGGRHAVLAGMRGLLPELQEVRYPAIVIDAGRYDAKAREPTLPILLIDVGNKRDFSTLADVTCLTGVVSDNLLIP
jgi:hypothetical protein